MRPSFCLALLPVVYAAPLMVVPGLHPGAPAAVPPALTLGGKVFIGDGTHSDGTYNGTSHVPFNSALAALGSTGGVIEVLPGTYTFGQGVTVSAPGVRICGARNATIQVTGGTVSGPALTVTSAAAGFALDGLTLREDRTNAEHLVSIAASDASVTGCAFLIHEDSSGDTTHALHLEGGRPLVQGNSFLFAPSAEHRVGLGATGCEGLRVVANEFRAEDPTEASAVQGAIVLADTVGAVIEANTFLALASLTTTSTDNATLVVREDGGTSSRTVVSGNVFGKVSGYSILSLEGDGFSHVQGNVFGREDVQLGVVSLAGGQGNVVTGNEFHDDGELGEVCVRADEQSNLLVSANTFLACRAPQIWLDGVQGASVLGNRFTQATGPLDYAVDVESTCARILVAGNALLGGDWDAVSAGGSAVQESHNYNP